MQPLRLWTAPFWQVAGAAVLTNVLETTPVEDLLAPGKAKQVGCPACTRRLPG